MPILDALWLRNPVFFFSAEGPGDPPEGQEPPLFSYEYREVPSRRPMPRDETAKVYDLTLELKRNNSVVKSFKVGEHQNWKGRKDPQVTFDGLVTSPDTPAIIRRRRNALFESQEGYGYNDELKGAEPPGGVYPPFTTGYAAFIENFIVDADVDTLEISSHGLSTGDGPFRFRRGQGVLPEGVSLSALYWVIVFDANKIKVAASKDNALNDIPVNLTSTGTAHSTRYLIGQNHWEEGFLSIPKLSGKYDVAIQTADVFFEPWDTGDTINFKVTTGSTYDSPEVSELPKIGAGKPVYILLVPQWWKFTINFDAWVVWKWASPDHRIGLNRPFRVPEAPVIDLAGLGAGNLEEGIYAYAVSWVTGWGETKAGDYATIEVLDNAMNGQARLSFASFLALPNDVTSIKLYRTEVNPPLPNDFRDDWKFVAEILVEDLFDDYVDNLADAGLGASAQSEYPYPLGGMAEGDWFFMPTDDEFDLAPGGDGPVTIPAGFYWCSNAPGATWDDLEFCAADATTPPSDGCFSYDKVRYRLAQAERACEAIGYKKALCRPVFPTETSEYSESSFTPGFPKLAVDYNPDLAIPFQSEDDFEEDGTPTIQTDDYESIVITSELADPEAQRALAFWAENSQAWNDYLAGKYLEDIGVNALILADIASEDSSFDFDLITVNTPDPSSDHILVLPSDFGTGNPSHWWSANGLLTVDRANTPAGSLVGALQIDDDPDQRYYIWRKTDSVGRTANIGTDIPFSTDETLDIPDLEAGRQRVRSEADAPPSVAELDYTF